MNNNINWMNLRTSHTNLDRHCIIIVLFWPYRCWCDVETVDKRTEKGSTPRRMLRLWRGRRDADTARPQAQRPRGRRASSARRTARHSIDQHEHSNNNNNRLDSTRLRSLHHHKSRVEGVHERSHVEYSQITWVSIPIHCLFSTFSETFQTCRFLNYLFFGF